MEFPSLQELLWKYWSDQCICQHFFSLLLFSGLHYQGKKKPPPPPSFYMDCKGRPENGLTEML